MLTWYRQKIAEISLHAIFGRTSGATKKLKGKLNSRDVILLVDSGSTHNFMEDALVTKLGLKVQQVTPFDVQIGNGNLVRCNCYVLELCSRITMFS